MGKKDKDGSKSPKEDKKKAKAAKAAAAAAAAVTTTTETENGDLVKPGMDAGKALDTSAWPYLLKNFSALNIRTSHYTPIPASSSPGSRKLRDYIRYGVINLDKVSGRAEPCSGMSR